jgi:predicted acylesterase/phospholipase RssA
MPTWSRAEFLAASALPALAGIQIGSATAALSDPTARARRALVLSGGGARGAYQAGIIESLASQSDARDGTPLLPYGLVCGTSIGALNGYFVATGQYTTLRELWFSVAQQQPIQLKREFAKITNDNSGVGSRIWQAVHLAAGLHSNVKGVIDGGHLRDWMAQYVNPSRAVVMPFVWTVTNLTTQRPEFFYLLPDQPDRELREATIHALAITLGPDTVIRPATQEILIDALRASAAVPLAFDPVVLPNVNGTLQEYVDGGVTANTPVGMARAAAHAIDVVFMDPVIESFTYNNALDVTFGVFGAMQRRILEADLRAAFLETFGKRAFGTDIPTTLQSQFAETLYDVDIATIRPKDELPVDVNGFDDQPRIVQTYEIGRADGLRGFSEYIASPASSLQR